MATTAFSQQLESLTNGLPDPVQAVLKKEQNYFTQEGASPNIIKTGAIVPDSVLLDPQNNEITLKEALGGKPAFLVFYRGDWCPFCNLTLRAYQQKVLPTLKENGVSIIAISPQKPDNSLSLQQKNELAFQVLSDSGNSLAAKLGLTIVQHSEQVKAFQQKKNTVVSATNLDGTHNLPMPAVIGIDANGVVRFVDGVGNYAQRTDPQQILDALPSVLQN